ncbi:MAG: isoprenylcysteine carboxylmethyltransferase family protein [Verrucomicrobiota bacterium]
MRLLDPLWLGAIYGLSEIYLAITRRSRTRVLSRDRRSLLILWVVIIISIFLAIQMVWMVPSAALPSPRAFYIAGFILFLAGLILRWYSVGYLGRFFTVNVSIDPDHHLVDSGPYRYIRHPSYTGALIAFLGFGFCLGNWVSILMLALPIIGAFLWRVRIEESALQEALGQEYRDYMRRTEALIPWVY